MNNISAASQKKNIVNNLIFWGVRGSFPIASRDMIRYGGNTSCISLQLDEDNILVLDAGSGLKNLGEKILSTYKDKLPELHILISHFMWDHIMGVPFFKPLYKQGCKINFYSAERDDHSLKEIFSVQHSRDYFHIDFVELDAHLDFYGVRNYESFRIKNAIITPVRLNHADITFGYIVEFLGKKIAYIMDTAPFTTAFLGTLPNPKYSETKYLNYIYQQLIKYVKDSNIVIIDAHFTLDEYKDKHHWGHSTPDHALDLCNKCNVRNLFLSHHAPEHTDDFIDKMVKETQAKNKNPNLRIFGAKENMTIKIMVSD